MVKKTDNKQLQQVQKPQTNLSDRFVNKVISTYQDTVQGITITQHERELISHYFIGIDNLLKATVEKKGRDGYTWAMVNMNDLAIAVASKARLGLDMGLDNMISFIPFKKGDTGKITLVPIIGYKGYEYIAKVYGLNPPKHSIVELVYETDSFVPYKKDRHNKKDDYEFQVNNPFNRGKVVGGFGYLEYDDETQNLLMWMTEEEILSYRKQYYDKTFWSGENAKKMYKKTIAKQLFKTVTLDPRKTSSVGDDVWDTLDKDELDLTSEYAHKDIAANMGTGDVIDITDEWDAEDMVKTIVENSVESEENIPVPEEPAKQPTQDSLF